MNKQSDALALNFSKAKVKIYDPQGMENAKNELPKSIKFCNDFSVENFPSDPKIFIGFLIEL